MGQIGLNQQFVTIVTYGTVDLGWSWRFARNYDLSDPTREHDGPESTQGNRCDIPADPLHVYYHTKL